MLVLYISSPPSSASNIQKKKKQKKDDDEFVFLRTDRVPEVFESWVLSRSSGGVKLQSPGQLISINVAARLPPSAPG